LLRAWAFWQRVLNALLRGPVGTTARRMLSRVRGRRLLRASAGGDAPNEALPTRAVE
jgi:hypothetical protein